MKIVKEISLKDFEFWGPAKEKVALLTDEELERMEEYYSIWEPDLTETELNDDFAYYFESICDILGLDEEEVLARS